MSAVDAPKGLLVLSVFLYGIGMFLGRRASANVMSGVFITVSILSLFYVGGWIYYLERGHLLTPFAVSAGVFWFGLGAYACARMARFVPGPEMNVFLSKKPVQLPHLDPGLLLGVWMMSIITMLLVAWFFSQVGIIFLSENVAQARSTAMAGRGIVFRGVIALLPISFTVIYAFRRFTKWRNGFLLAAGIVIVSVASVLMFGSRGFAAFFIIPGLIMIGYSRTRVNQWQILLLIVLFVFLAVGFQYRYRDYRDLSLGTSIVTVLRRMTRSQAQGVDHIIYSLIPDRGFYRGGILWWDFRGLLATFRIVSPEQTFSSWLWQHLGAFRFPYENYTLSTTIVGDLYADYGLLAISTGMLFYGALAQWLYIKVIRGRKHWFRIAMLCFAQYILISAHISGSIFGVFSIRGLSLILYFLLVRGFASVCVQRTQSHQCDQLHERVA